MAEGRGGALRELVAFLGFDLDKKPLEEADKGMERFEKRAELVKTALETVGVALGVREIAEFISSQIEMGAALEHTSAQLGIGVDDLQAFQYAAETTGVSADDAGNALGFLNRAIGSATTGNEEAAKAFSQFHVALKDASGQARPLSDVVGDLADGFARSNDTGKKTVVAMTLFGRAGRALIPLLNKGKEGAQGLFDEFDKLGGGLSEDFIKSAEEAEHSMVAMKTASRGLYSELGAALLPTVTDFVMELAHGVASLREWLSHTHLLRNALITLAAIAGVLVITWGILNIEILLVVAALALLALAVDDVITFFEGGDSVLGRFLDKIYGVGESKKIAQELKDAWKEVSDAFGKLWDAVKNLGPDLKDLFDTLTKKKSDVNGAKSSIQGIADAVTSLANALTTAVTELDTLVAKFNKFAKDHPVLAHTVERAENQFNRSGVLAASPVNAIPVLAGSIREAITGNTGDITPGLPNPTGTVNVHKENLADFVGAGQPTVVQQHNETHVQLYGVPGADQALFRLSGVVKDAQTDANNAAFPAVGGGGAP